MSEHTYPNTLRNTGGTTALGNPIWECLQCGAIGQSFNDRGRLRCREDVRDGYRPDKTQAELETSLLDARRERDWYSAGE